MKEEKRNIINIQDGAKEEKLQFGAFAQRAGNTGKALSWIILLIKSVDFGNDLFQVLYLH